MSGSHIVSPEHTLFFRKTHCGSGRHIVCPETTVFLGETHLRGWLTPGVRTPGVRQLVLSIATFSAQPPNPLGAVPPSWQGQMTSRRFVCAHEMTFGALARDQSKNRSPATDHYFNLQLVQLDYMDESSRKLVRPKASSAENSFNRKLVQPKTSSAGQVQTKTSSAEN